MAADCCLNEKEPLPLRRDLICQPVDGFYLWLGVEEGLVAVLDADEQLIFRLLMGGQPPAQALWHLVSGHGGVVDARNAERQWQRIVALIQKVAEAGFVCGIEGYHDVREVSPERYARLHLTGRCQLRCVHCYANSGPEVDGSRELPTAQWLKIIDDIAQHGGESVVFTGGEPLLREDSVQLMRHARERGLQVNLLTNGLRVKKLLPALTEAVSFVQVSLNGPDEASNDAIRGPGTFRRVIDALDALLEAGIPTRVGMTVMDMNWQAVRVGFLAFAEGYAGTPLRFHLGYGLCHFGRAEGLEDNFDLEDARPLLDSYLASVNHWEGRRITRKTTGCGYCEQLVVAPNGVVYPCHLLDGPLGLIDDRPLSAWHTTLRALALDHSVDRVEGCHSCYLRYLCGGTCRVINEKRTGSRLVTTCSEAERTARNRSLVRLFGPSAAYPARARPVQAG